MKMKSIILLCIISTVLSSLVEDRQQWLNFKSKHGKLYKNIEEERQRFSIFQKNLRAIEEHNKDYEAGKTTYFKGVNEFTDLTKEEFRARLKRVGRPNREIKDVYEAPLGADVPTSIDWRDKGAVSKVKTQGFCGSCWAFSVTGTLEGFYFLKNNKMILFSEQQLVDCVTDNDGCGGGFEDTALSYVQKNGIQSEETYPYREDDTECSYNKSAVVAQISKYVQLERKDENALKSAVGLLGPISVAIDADGLYSYEGGVFSDDDCATDFDDLNHAVLAVGYGKDEKTGLDYWLVKNSWGEDWGENGYFKLLRGSNMCGIATDAMYPVF